METKEMEKLKDILWRFAHQGNKVGKYEDAIKAICQLIDSKESPEHEELELLTLNHHSRPDLSETWRQGAKAQFEVDRLRVSALVAKHQAETETKSFFKRLAWTVSENPIAAYIWGVLTGLSIGIIFWGLE